MKKVLHDRVGGPLEIRKVKGHALAKDAVGDQQAITDKDGNDEAGAAATLYMDQRFAAKDASDALDHKAEGRTLAAETQAFLIRAVLLVAARFAKLTTTFGRLPGLPKGKCASASQGRASGPKPTFAMGTAAQLVFAKFKKNRENTHS